MAEVILSQTEKNTRTLPQIPIEVRYNTNFYRLPLEESIDLSDGNYVMGVILFNTYNSIFNITEKKQQNRLWKTNRFNHNEYYHRREI